MGREAAAKRSVREEPAVERRERTVPPLSTYNAPGGLRQDPGRAPDLPAEAETTDMGVTKMRVLSTYGSRGSVQPVVAPAVQLRTIGAGVQV